MKYKLIKKYPGSKELGFISSEDYSAFPEFWQKVVPILQTKEGQYVYEGDQYYTVYEPKTLSGYTPMTLYGPHTATALKKNEEWSSHVNFFISKVVADKYITDHKPSISIQEVLDAYESSVTREGMYIKLLKVKK